MKCTVANSKATRQMSLNEEGNRVDKKKAKIVVRMNAINADKNTMDVVRLVVRWIESRLW